VQSSSPASAGDPLLQSCLRDWVGQSSGRVVRFKPTEFRFVLMELQKACGRSLNHGLGRLAESSWSLAKGHKGQIQSRYAVLPHARSLNSFSGTKYEARASSAFWSHDDRLNVQRLQHLGARNGSRLARCTAYEDATTPGCAYEWKIARKHSASRLQGASAIRKILMRQDQQCSCPQKVPWLPP